MISKYKVSTFDANCKECNTSNDIEIDVYNEEWVQSLEQEIKVLRKALELSYMNMLSSHFVVDECNPGRLKQTCNNLCENAIYAARISINKGE